MGAVAIPASFSMVVDYNISLYVLFVNTILSVIICYILNKAIPDVPSIQIILLFYILFISLLAILSYSDSIKLGSETYPNLAQPDSGLYYNAAVDLAKTDIIKEYKFLRGNFLGYQVILAYLLKYFGMNLFICICFSYIMLVLSVLLITLTTFNITRNSLIAKYTLTCSVFMPIYIQYGTILLKDIVVIFGFSLFMYSYLCYINNKYKPIKYLIYMFIALSIVAITRFQYVIFCILLLFVPPASKYLRKILVVFAIILLFLMLMLPIYFSFSTMELNNEYIEDVLVEHKLLDDATAESSGAVARLMSGYSSYSFFKKLLYLPITTAIQIATPFNFWKLSFLEKHIWYFYSEQLNIIWILIFSGLMLFSAKNIMIVDNLEMRNLFLLGFIIYLITAYMYGGVVPRYAAPAFVFMLPAMGYWMYKFVYESGTKRKMKKFYTVYYLLVSILFLFYITYKL